MRRKRDADEKAVIADVIRRSVEWGLTKDVEMQRGTLAHDDNLFIIWTASWHVTSGWREHEKHLETVLDPRFKAERAEVRDLQIHLSRSGDVAWFSAMLDDVISWDGKTDRFGEGLRWTGVLEKRVSRWVIVQLHASLPVDTVREVVMRDVQSRA